MDFLAWELLKIIFQSNQFRTENLVLYSESHKNTEKKSKFLFFSLFTENS